MKTMTQIGVEGSIRQKQENFPRTKFLIISVCSRKTQGFKFWYFPRKGFLDPNPPHPPIKKFLLCTAILRDGVLEKSILDAALRVKD